MMSMDNGHSPNFPFFLSPSGFDRRKVMIPDPESGISHDQHQVAEPDPGSGAFLTPESGMEKNLEPETRDLRKKFLG
jgi:hypothetical protein